MLKSPGFTATVLLTLLLTVGVNTALFSVIRAVLLRPLPFPEPERLVWITEEYKALGLDAALGSDFLAWKSDNQVFQELAAFTPTEVNLRGHGYPQRVPGTRVSRGFFAVLGIQPAIGRVFNTREDSPGGRQPSSLARTCGGRILQLARISWARRSWSMESRPV